MYSLLLTSLIAIPQPVVWETAQVTAYTCDVHTPQQKAMNCPNGITATGTIPTSSTLACDKSLLGKWVEIAEVGIRQCEDTGGRIKGNKFDVYLDSYQKAINFGVKELAYVVL